VKVKHVNPVYPQGSAAGIVRLDTLIGTDGFVKDLTVTSSTAPALALAAENAVRQWQFDETLLNCVPVEVRMSVVVEFQ
jgi:outer membrane biosynthesis protein TonB